MRDYGRVAPTFWTRGSGKKLRGNPHAQIVALYLFTCPASTMVGIYHLAIPTMAHETGLTPGEAERALADVVALDVARYDPEEELVYLPEGARYQIGESLKPGDKRVAGIRSALAQFSRHPFALDFAQRYAADFCLGAPPSKPLPDESEAPSKPLPRGIQKDAMPLGSQARQGAEQEKQEITHTSRAHGREPKSEGEDHSPITEVGLGALLREVPALAALADDPAMVTDLHGGFRMACMDAATVGLARSALGVLAGRENLRDMPPWKQRERVGTYLGKARQYSGSSDRGSEPTRATDDQRAVLSVFAEEWSARKKRDFVQSAGDEKHAAAIVEAAWDHAARLKMRPRDIVRHWAKGYLADADKFVADREHPLSLLPSRLTSYGLPKPATPKPSAAPEEPLVGTPMPPGMLDAIGAQGPRDGPVPRRRGAP